MIRPETLRRLRAATDELKDAKRDLDNRITSLEVETSQEIVLAGGAPCDVWLHGRVPHPFVIVAEDHHGVNRSWHLGFFGFRDGHYRFAVDHGAGPIMLIAATLSVKMAVAEYIHPLLEQVRATCHPEPVTPKTGAPT